MKEPETMRKPPEPSVRHGYVIIGPYGNVWHTDVFDTPAKAEAYLREFWEGTKVKTFEGYTICAGRKTVAADTIETHTLCEAVKP